MIFLDIRSKTRYHKIIRGGEIHSIFAGGDLINFKITKMDIKVDSNPL